MILAIIALAACLAWCGYLAWLYGRPRAKLRGEPRVSDLGDKRDGVTVMMDETGRIWEEPRVSERWRELAAKAKEEHRAGRTEPYPRLSESRVSFPVTVVSGEDDE